MRTTVTLEPDIAARLKDLAHRRRLSFKSALNEVLRRGLGARIEGATRTPRFSVEPHRGGFRAGVDPAKLNQLVDDLEVEAFAAGKRPQR